MNGDAKCSKWVGLRGLGWFGVTRSHRQYVTIRQSAYDFLFGFNRNCVSISYRFPRCCELFIESRRFSSIPTAFGTPLLEFHQDVWHQKTRLPGLLRGVICVMNLAVLVELSDL